MKLRSAVFEVAVITTIFVALTGYAFALLGQTTVDRIVVIFYFGFIARVLMRCGTPGRSKVVALLIMAICAMLAAWIGYSLDPPNYSLVGHFIFALAAIWCIDALLSAVDLGMDRG